MRDIPAALAWRLDADLAAPTVPYISILLHDLPPATLKDAVFWRRCVLCVDHAYLALHA